MSDARCLRACDCTRGRGKSSAIACGAASVVIHSIGNSLNWQGTCFFTPSIKPSLYIIPALVVKGVSGKR